MTVRINGCPMVMTVEGMEFRRASASSKTYKSLPMQGVEVTLEPNESGVWTCEVRAAGISHREDNSRVMEGRAYADGYSINASDAVRLALNCLSRLTVALASVTSGLGLIEDSPVVDPATGRVTMPPKDPADDEEGD